MEREEAKPELALAQAATTLSSILTADGIRHAFIGGFALRTYGSDRATEDVDIEVDVAGPNERLNLVRTLASRDSRFSADALARLFFTPTEPPQQSVRMELLPIGTLGLPQHLQVETVESGKASPHSPLF